MKNISNFILEKLKVSSNKRQYNLPTWKEFVDALEHVPDKSFDLAEFFEEFKDAEIKDFPTFVPGDEKRYLARGHILELHANPYNTGRDPSLIINFKHGGIYADVQDITFYDKDHEILINSLGEDFYLKIYNKMKELYGD